MRVYARVQTEAVTCQTEKRGTPLNARYLQLSRLFPELRRSALTLKSALLTTAFAASFESAYLTRYNAKLP